MAGWNRSAGGGSVQGRGRRRRSYPDTAKPAAEGFGPNRPGPPVAAHAQNARRTTGDPRLLLVCRWRVPASSARLPVAPLRAARPSSPIASPSDKQNCFHPAMKGSRCQPACKPGSVWPRMPCGVRNVAAIHLGRMLPSASCDQPGRLGRKSLKVALRAAPIRSCSRWGLPCRNRCRPRGGLLPHPFTLTPPANRPGGSALPKLVGRFAGGAVSFLWHFP